MVESEWFCARLVYKESRTDMFMFNELKLWAQAQLILFQLEAQLILFQLARQLIYLKNNTFRCLFIHICVNKKVKL